MFQKVERTKTVLFMFSTTRLICLFSWLKKKIFIILTVILCTMWSRLNFFLLLFCIWWSDLAVKMIVWWILIIRYIFMFHKISSEAYVMVQILDSVSKMPQMCNIESFVNNLLTVCDLMWLDGRKGIRPVKNWVVGCWCGYLGWGADLHMALQMPLPLTISCSSKSRLVLPSWFLPFWYLLTRVVLDGFQKSSKVVVCVLCVCVEFK